MRLCYQSPPQKFNVAITDITCRNNGLQVIRYLERINYFPSLSGAHLCDSRRGFCADFGPISLAVPEGRFLVLDRVSKASLCHVACAGSGMGKDRRYLFLKSVVNLYPKFQLVRFDVGVDKTRRELVVLRRELQINLRQIDLIIW